MPGPDDDPDNLPEPVAFVRDVQEKRLRSAERKLNQLGRVNPLALEEFAALEERHKFLTEQLEDLKSSKDDLLLSLLASEAIVDSRGFEILSAEEVEELKKVRTFIAG